MSEYKNELSNLSYTNKDFSTIYPELLDIVKKLSYKWDPTISDESDPGVVLLKLNALMTDKLNYNIDKNILELFPSSVTQYQNAREIFDQCGYTMRYYNSAEVKIAFYLKRFPTVDELGGNQEELDTTDTKITIPIFTMFSTPDNSLVYTITKNVVLSDVEREVQVEALEGQVQDYTINGETLITANMLDPKNRLYFSGLDIAENGIFISSDSMFTSTWDKVSNLVLQELNTPCYKFGVTKDGTRCYVEFPSDINQIIGNGIYIKYLRTRGVAGRIHMQNITNFYTDPIAYAESLSGSSAEKHQFSITLDHVSFTNPLSSTGGDDPETIEEANRNYQKIKTTFSTLVSLRDYNNFIYSSKMVSNGFVTDRLNDPQSTYKILQKDENSETTHIKTKSKDIEFYDEDGNELTSKVYVKNNIDEYIPYTEDQMSAFDLKIYGFDYIDTITSDLAFDASFSCLSNIHQKYASYGLQTQWDKLTDNKCIQHDFKDYEINVPFMFKNKYPVKAVIIPMQKLDTLSKSAILKSIKSALYKLLNSRACLWGETPDYATVYQTILTADSRIRAVLLEDFSYETYAIYVGENKVITEQRIDKNFNSDNDIVKNIRNEIKNRSYLAGVTPLIKRVNNFTQLLSNTNTKTYYNINKLRLENNVYSSKVSRGDDDGSKEVTIEFALKTGDQVTFTANSLIKDQEYTNYVKYITNIKTNSGTHYTLQGDDYIIFLWKTDDNESTPYTYHKYTSTTQKDGRTTVNTIESSIQLESNCDKVTDQEFIKYLKDERRSFSGTIPNKYQDTIKSLYDDDFVLTPNKTIKTLKQNSVKIGTDSSRYIVFVSNTKNPIKLNDEKKFHILSSNEYLLYTNAQKTTLNLLGEGTKIELPTNNTDATSYEVTITPCSSKLEEIEDKGMMLLDTLWTKVTNQTSFNAVEQEYISIGPSNTITISYTYSDENPPTDNYKIDSDGLKQIEEDNRETTIKLTNVNISYKSSNSTSDTITNLPVKTSSSDAWRVSAALHLDVSEDKPHQLSAGQVLYLCDNDEDEYVSVLGDEDVYIQTNHPVVLNQTINNDDIIVKNDTAFSTLSFYTYTSDNGNLNYFIPQFTEETSDSGENKQYKATINASLGIGLYILPVDIVNNNLNWFEITADNGVIITNLLSNEYGQTADNNTHNYGKHWYTIESKSATEFTLTLTVKSQSDISNDVLRLLPLLQLSSNTSNELGDGTELRTTCYNLSTQYDTEHLFNYTADFDSETQIIDPLDSYSFFNPNHVMNKYTIAQAYFTTYGDDDSINETIRVDDRVR